MELVSTSVFIDRNWFSQIKMVIPLQKQSPVIKVSLIHLPSELCHSSNYNGGKNIKKSVQNNRAFHFTDPWIFQLSGGLALTSFVYKPFEKFLVASILWICRTMLKYLVLKMREKCSPTMYCTFL